MGIDVYFILNRRVPVEEWLDIAKHNPRRKKIGFDKYQIFADAHNADELDGFIRCLWELLSRGYQYGEDFELSSAG